MRERLRIRLPTPPRRWTRRETLLLGRFNDREVASRLEEDAVLGTDAEIAALIGRKVEVVCIRRQKLRIPNFYWLKQRGRERRFVGNRKAQTRTAQVSWS